MLVLSGSATRRATGHAHRPRRSLSRHTHPHLPRDPGLASPVHVRVLASAAAVLSARGIGSPRVSASTGRPPGRNPERDKIPLECGGFSARDGACQNRHSGETEPL